MANYKQCINLIQFKIDSNPGLDRLNQFLTTVEFSDD